jgi:hypothetical protein
MRSFWIVAGAALALSGCQSPEEKRAAETGEIDVANASLDQVAGLAEAARSKSGQRPGMWQTAFEVVSADLSALPESERDGQFGAIKQLEHSSTVCRTARELKPLDLDNIQKLAGACVFPHYVQKNGRIDAEIHCGEGASKTVLVASGAYGPTAYDLTIDQTTGTPGAADYLGLKLRAKGTRTGNCTPKPAG